MNTIDLNIENVKSYTDYKDVWKKVGKVKITCIEKNEECKHNVGDSYIFETPYNKPENVCPALLHVIDLYIWRVTLGFPSWNQGNYKIFKLHCPDPKGTVWEMEKINEVNKNA